MIQFWTFCLKDLQRIATLLICSQMPTVWFDENLIKNLMIVSKECFVLIQITKLIYCISGRKIIIITA